MKTIAIMILAAGLFSAPAFAAGALKPITCTETKGNWKNYSKKTCHGQIGGGGTGYDGSSERECPDEHSKTK